MRRDKGKCDIFFGIEHRLREGEMQEQFSKEGKEGWRFHRFQREQMQVAAPSETSTGRSKGQKGEWIERTYEYVLAKKISHMKVVEYFESRPHKAVSFVVEKEKEIQEWNEQKLPKVLLGHSGGKLKGRSAKERGGEEEEEEKDSRERQVRYEIGREVAVGIKEKAGVHEDAKSTQQRSVGQGRCQSKEGWVDAEVVQKALELVVHERMSQGRGVTCTKEKKKVKGWSAEEMKGKPSRSLEEDTEGKKKRRSLRQDEIDQC